MKSARIWGMAGALLWIGLVVVSVGTVDFTGLSSWQTVTETLWALVPASFAAAAGLIIARQPRNPIGWVLLVPGMLGFLDPLLIQPLASTDAPPSLSPWLLAQLWADNFGWLLLVFPVFHLLLIFPTGRVVSIRWRWLVRLEVAMIALLAVCGLLADRLGPFAYDENPQWTVDNPIGFISQEFFDSPAFGIPWTAGLIVITLGGVASILVRYRRGNLLERQQIKLVLWAVALFAAAYVPLAIFSESWEGGGILDAMYVLAFHLIPAAIVASVLRYRLFDIDILIRRTILYGLLVAALAGIYFGLIAALSTIVPSDDPLAVAVSTLAVAALFNPLRRQVREFLDHRFNRSRYDREVMLDAFAGSLQSTSDPDGVVASWRQVAILTMQPTAAGVWLREGPP